ncbi:amidohydrolase family protein [Paraburkholderia youngii]|uniref:Amidohydrolase family protein n=1 Tax=Paraburkholderia youngii TaxID=2782701 RepID=A0A7Y6MWB3_9BURK|nr:amidohydrolase family protein [Paraburkholderia youngii]NUX99507.1 amidohydrolase family protein [Paraburkholderia youngii]
MPAEQQYCSEKSAVTNSSTHLPVRAEWLATHSEMALDPALPVIDSHHHLYDRPGSRYLFDDLLCDIRDGHNVRATVIVQARSMLRADVPAHLQPLGETEFANGVAAMSASGIYGDARVCAGIVGFADLTLGDAIRPVLERHISLAGGPIDTGGRFRGVRQSLTWDADASLTNPLYPTTQSMMDEPLFRRGFAHLAPLGLSFEAWVFFHQLSRVAGLARAFPQTQIVLNHCGGVLGIAAYANRQAEVFTHWKLGLQELADCPNVMVKLSGLGMRLGGFAFSDRERAPSSDELADAWRPWIDTCIDTFGPDRCMYGSNFPVDKGSYGYGIGLNALKRLTAEYSRDDRANIFWRSAQTFYRLPESSMVMSSSNR